MKKLVTNVLMKDLVSSGSTQKAILIQIRSPLLILDKMFFVNKNSHDVEDALKNDLIFAKDGLLPLLKQVANIGEMSISVNRNLFLHSLFKTGTVYQDLFESTTSKDGVFAEEVLGDFKEFMQEHHVYWSENDVESSINDNHEWIEFESNFAKKVKVFEENNNSILIKNEPISMVVYFDINKIENTDIDALYFKTCENEKGYVTTKSKDGFIILDPNFNLSSVIENLGKFLSIEKEQKVVYVFDKGIKNKFDNVVIQNNKLICFKNKRIIEKRIKPVFSFEKINGANFLEIHDNVLEIFYKAKKHDENLDKVEVLMFVDKKKSKQHCITAKMLVNGEEKETIMNCFKNPHEGVFKTINMLNVADEESLIINLSGFDISQPLVKDKKTKRLTSMIDKGEVAKYNDYMILLRDRSYIFERFSKKDKRRMEDVRNFKVFNGETFVYPEEIRVKQKVKPKDKIAPKEVKNTVKKEPIKEVWDEKMTLVVEKLKSFESKRSCHNKVYFYMEESEKDQSYRVHVISDVLSKHGESRVLNYENVYMIAKEWFEKNPLRELKNPLKIVNKMRAVEVVIVFDEKEKAIKARKEKLIINKKLFRNNLFDQERYIVNFKCESDINHDVIYKINKNKNSEFDDDRDEFIVDESKTAEDTLCVYSDASFRSGKSLKEFTYGVVLKGLGRKFMGRGYSSYIVSPDSSEFNAIVSALNIIKDLKQKNEIPFDKKLEIRCDCLNAVRFFNNDLNTQKLHKKEMLNEVNDLEIAKVNFLLKQPELLNKVDFRWLKGHVNEKHNEMADSLAKKAYEEIKEINKVIEII